jgi:hypothetical protein
MLTVYPYKTDKFKMYLSECSNWNHHLMATFEPVKAAQPIYGVKATCFSNKSFYAK